MRFKTLALAAAVLALPVALSVPSEAKTAFQYWAQGQGVYVPSTVHPPGGIQSLLLDAAGYPVPPPGYYGDIPHPPPPGYAYPYGPYGGPGY